MANIRTSRPAPSASTGISTLVIGLLDWIGRFQLVKDMLTAAVGLDIANALTSWWLPPALMLIGIYLLFKKSRAQTKLWRGVGLSLAIFAGLFGLALFIEYVTSPHLHATNGRFVITNTTEGPQPRAAVMFFLHIGNSGKPSTTGNWGLTVTFTDGENVYGIPLVGEHDLTQGGRLWRHFTREEDITFQTSTSPIQQGAAVVGMACFDLPGIRTETLLQPGTIFDVSYEDITKKRYSFREIVPAREVPH